MTLCACGKQAEPGRAECFHCRVSTVGFTFNGGALQGKAGFKAMTKGEWMREHLGTDNERELARNTNIDRYDPDATYYDPEG